MKHLRWILSVTVLLSVLTIGMATVYQARVQADSPVKSIPKCECWYPNTNEYGIIIWPIGCDVRNCWIPLPSTQN